MSRFPPLDLSKVRTYPLGTRPSKVAARALGRVHRAGGSRLFVRTAMHDRRLGDLPADRHRRIQRAGRVLEDHPDIVAADLVHLLLGQLRQVELRTVLTGEARTVVHVVEKMLIRIGARRSIFRESLKYT